MTNFLSYGKAYDGKIILFPVTKELLEIRRHGYFDIKPSRNVKQILETLNSIYHIIVRSSWV